MFDFVLLDADRIAMADAISPLSWKRQAVVALAVVAITGLLLTMTNEPLVILLWGAGGLFGVLTARAFRPRVIRYQLKRKGIGPHSVRVEVSEGAVVHREDGLFTEVSWARMRRCILTSEIVALEYGPLRTIVVPRRVMTSTQVALLEQLAGKQIGVPTPLVP